MAVRRQFGGSMFSRNNVRKGPGGYELVIGTYSAKALANPLAGMQQDIEPGFICKDGFVRQIPLPLRGREGKITINFGEIEPLPAGELCTSLRGEALSYVKSLWQAVSLMRKDDLPLQDGMLPLYSFFFTTEGSVIFLSRQLTDQVHFCLSEDDGFSQSFSFSWPAYSTDSKIKVQMAMLLYFAQTGFMPFSDERIRYTGQANLLKLSMTGAEPALAGAIDQALEIRPATDFDPESWLDSLHWSVSDGILDTPAVKQWNEKIDRKLNHLTFWRKKGWIVFLVTGIVLAVLAFGMNYIAKQFGPPQSAGLSQEEVVLYYFTAQNNLDVECLTDTLSWGVKSPVYDEVARLFVSSMARRAYEQYGDTVMSASDFVASGVTELPQDSYVYGVEQVSIERIGPDTLRTTSILYSPYDYDSISDAVDEIPTECDIYVYRQVQTFTFTEASWLFSSRTWQEISSITVESVKMIDHIVIPYVPRTGTLLIY